MCIDVTGEPRVALEVLSAQGVEQVAGCLPVSTHIGF
jgi:hypothetical protein